MMLCSGGAVGEEWRWRGGTVGNVDRNVNDTFDNVSFYLHFLILQDNFLGWFFIKFDLVAK